MYTHKDGHRDPAAYRSQCRRLNYPGLHPDGYFGVIRFPIRNWSLPFRNWAKCSNALGEIVFRRNIIGNNVFIHEF